MADIKTKDARSKNMAAIRSRETKPEIYSENCFFPEDTVTEKM